MTERSFLKFGLAIPMDLQALLGYVHDFATKFKDFRRGGELTIRSTWPVTGDQIILTFVHSEAEWGSHSYTLWEFLKRLFELPEEADIMPKGVALRSLYLEWLGDLDRMSKGLVDALKFRVDVKQDRDLDVDTDEWFWFTDTRTTLVLGPDPAVNKWDWSLFSSSRP